MLPTRSILRPHLPKTIALVPFSVALSACQPPNPFADAVFHNAVVITMEDGQPRASALAVSGERILAVGDLETMRPHVGEDTRVYDLGGRTILPKRPARSGRRTGPMRPTAEDIS